MNFLERLLHIRLPEGPPPVKPGIYHYRRQEGGVVTRFHLRVEEDGTGLLLANAAVAARLSAAGAAIARGLLEEQSEADIRETIKKGFRGAKNEKVDADLLRIRDFIATLAKPEDNYPIFNLDDPAVSTPKTLFAPVHAQMPVGASEQVNPLLEKLWDNGIMHVTFRALLSTRPEEAVHNVERAEDLGMISGLRAAASWMRTSDVLERSAAAGVDYITVPLLTTDKQKHDRWMGPGDFAKVLRCFAECVELDVCPVAEVPLFKENWQGLKDLLELFDSHRVRNVLSYAIASDYHPSGLSAGEIIQAAACVEELSHTSDVRYVWQPPVSRKGDLRVIFEEGPRAAGDVSIRVELDGSVYPARGPLTSAGNMKTDSWQSIWNHDVFKRYRTRILSPTRCDICPGLQICAADCPGNREGWATDSE